MTPRPARGDKGRRSPSGGSDGGRAAHGAKDYDRPVNRPVEPWSRRGGLDRAAASGLARGVLVALLLVGATVAIALLQEVAGAASSPVYLIPVVAAAVLWGTASAVGVAVAAVLLFDVLFTAPQYTLTIDDPAELIDLVIFLFVAIVVGRLTAIVAARAQEAQLRADEAQALFAISRALAVAPDLASALPDVLARLAIEAEVSRAWVTVGDGPSERTLAASGPAPDAPSGTVATLARATGDDRPHWVRSRDPHARASGRADASLYRVKLEAEGEPLGSLWAVRPRGTPDPGRSHARLLALTADQVALAVRREQLAEEVTGAEIARRSDRMKSALLDSVSHDLRTPLAGIRALAGGLMDPVVEPVSEERRRVAAAIDDEAQRLDRLVRDLLDASRIESGSLRPDQEACDLEDLVVRVLERVRPRLGARPVEVDFPAHLPPVWVDALFVEQIVANLLENVARHAGPDVPVRIGASALDRSVTLLVEDGGPGLSQSERDAVFQRLPQTRSTPSGSVGLGLGMSIVRGLTESMGGRATAAPSSLGGLAVRVELPSVPFPAEPA